MSVFLVTLLLFAGSWCSSVIGLPMPTITQPTDAVDSVDTTTPPAAALIIASSGDGSNHTTETGDLRSAKHFAAPKLYMKADPRKRKTVEQRRAGAAIGSTAEWQCPNITSSRNLECGCDMPHTLRCSGDIHSLAKIATALRQSPYDVSLLDCTLKNVTFLSDERIFENVSLHGLVISSGEIKRVHRVAFLGLRTPLQALGLPNNALMSVPASSLTPFALLERLDLSNNRIKTLGATDFVSLPNLTYLELSDNQISSISLRAFAPLRRLTILKLNGNRMADFTSSLHAIAQAPNLRELDLRSNSLSGPLTRTTLPALAALELLNLDRNSFTSIQNGALAAFGRLVTLSLRHNQIDVLQDHAFAGLAALQSLDLGYNGIVAVSGASLQHLGRLLVLDLTHNFLRALTADLTAPLPALRELRLAGNDISIVARNALDGAGELHSLSLQDNPLACDCTLRPFAEWLQQVSKMASQDLLGAICATPPALEGAPLLQVPVESLSCETASSSAGAASAINMDNANVLQQLDAIGRNNGTVHLSAAAVRDSSDVIQLKRLHLSADYGMILTWAVNMRSDEFTCDAVFVYKELQANEILLDNSPIHCESYMMDNENIVSVILRDTSDLQLGESYRFCLVLLHDRPNQKRDLVVGCSNQTRLQAFEDDAPDNDATDDSARLQMQKYYDVAGDLAVAAEPVIATDYASNRTQQQTPPQQKQSNQRTTTLGSGQTILVNNHIGGGVVVADGVSQRAELLQTLNRSFLPGLAMGILITGALVLLFGIVRLRVQRLPLSVVAACGGAVPPQQQRQASANNGTTCYAASGAHVPGPDADADGGGTMDHHNRYLKLQATTSL